MGVIMRSWAASRGGFGGAQRTATARSRSVGELLLYPNRLKAREPCVRVHGEAGGPTDARSM